LLERFSISVPAVINNIYRSAVPAQNICRNGVPPRSGTTTPLLTYEYERKTNIVMLHRQNKEFAYVYTAHRPNFEKYRLRP